MCPMNVLRNVPTLWSAKMVAASGQLTWNWCVPDQVLSKFGGLLGDVEQQFVCGTCCHGCLSNNQSRSTRCVLEP